MDKSQQTSRARLESLLTESVDLEEQCTYPTIREIVSRCTDGTSDQGLYKLTLLGLLLEPANMSGKLYWLTEQQEEQVIEAVLKRPRRSVSQLRWQEFRKRVKNLLESILSREGEKMDKELFKEERMAIVNGLMYEQYAGCFRALDNLKTISDIDKRHLWQLLINNEMIKKYYFQRNIKEQVEDELEEVLKTFISNMKEEEVSQIKWQLINHKDSQAECIKSNKNIPLSRIEKERLAAIVSCLPNFRSYCQKHQQKQSFKAFSWDLLSILTFDIELDNQLKYCIYDTLLKTPRHPIDELDLRQATKVQLKEELKKCKSFESYCRQRLPVSLASRKTKAIQRIIKDLGGQTELQPFLQSFDIGSICRIHKGNYKQVLQAIQKQQNYKECMESADQDWQQIKYDLVEQMNELLRINNIDMAESQNIIGQVLLGKAYSLIETSSRITPQAKKQLTEYLTEGILYKKYKKLCIMPESLQCQALKEVRAILLDHTFRSYIEHHELEQSIIKFKNTLVVEYADSLSARDQRSIIHSLCDSRQCKSYIEYRHNLGIDIRLLQYQMKQSLYSLYGKLSCYVPFVIYEQIVESLVRDCRKLKFMDDVRIPRQAIVEIEEFFKKDAMCIDYVNGVEIIEAIESEDNLMKLIEIKCKETSMANDTHLIQSLQKTYRDFLFYDQKINIDFSSMRANSGSSCQSWIIKEIQKSSEHMSYARHYPKIIGHRLKEHQKLFEYIFTKVAINKGLTEAQAQQLLSCIDNIDEKLSSYMGRLGKHQISELKGLKNLQVYTDIENIKSAQKIRAYEIKKIEFDKFIYGMRNNQELNGLNDQQKQQILKAIIELKIEALSDCKDISERNKESICRRVAMSKQLDVLCRQLRLTGQVIGMNAFLKDLKSYVPNEKLSILEDVSDGRNQNFLKQLSINQHKSFDQLSQTWSLFSTLKPPTSQISRYCGRQFIKKYLEDAHELRIKIAKEFIEQAIDKPQDRILNGTIKGTYRHQEIIFKRLFEEGDCDVNHIEHLSQNQKRRFREQFIHVRKYTKLHNIMKEIAYLKPMLNIQDLVEEGTQRLLSYSKIKLEERTRQAELYPQPMKSDLSLKPITNYQRLFDLQSSVSTKYSQLNPYSLNKENVQGQKK